MAARANRRLVILATLFLFLHVAFLTLFRSDLHCTQRTSFAIATFEADPHLEERQANPWVYRWPQAYVLRGYLSGMILAGLLFPPGALFLVAKRRMKPRTWFAGSAGLLLGATLNRFLPEDVVGERYSALLSAAWWVSIPAVLLPSLILWFGRRLDPKPRAAHGWAGIGAKEE